MTGGSGPGSPRPGSDRAECGARDAAPSAVERLVDVGREAFATDHWGRTPVLTRHDHAFDDLFGADAVDELVAERGLRTPFARMASEGRVLPSSEYTASGGFGAEIADQLDSAAVLAGLAAGATLVLQGLHRTWAPVGSFARRLADELGHPAQVNAYITPAANRGFDPHYDTHDVFVVQIAGAKRWRIHRPVHEHPLADQPWSDRRDAVAARAAEEPMIDAVFEPGDVLYLPRGWIHSATAQGGTSIHLTIGIKAVTRLDLLREMLARAGDDPELRRPLAMGVDYADAHSMAPEVAATVAAASALLDRVDAAAVARGMQRDHVGATRPDPVRAVATLDLLGDLDPGARVGWRGFVRARIRDDADRVHIELASKTVSLPAAAGAAVRALRDAPHPAGDLPGLDRQSSLVVSRRLLREGVIVPR